MPRYFFHLTNGDTIADDIGEEFDLLEEARGHAVVVAGELSHGVPPSRYAGRYIAVVDEGGVVVFTVLLRAAVILAVLVGTIDVFC